jgi:hypothetical protein
MASRLFQKIQFCKFLEFFNPKPQLVTEKCSDTFSTEHELQSAQFFVFVFVFFPNVSVARPKLNYIITALLIYACFATATQGCQMAFFRTKINLLGKFLRDLQRKMLVYFIAIWSILRPFGIYCGHLVHFKVSLVYFSRFGMLHQEKSGNPAAT